MRSTSVLLKTIKSFLDGIRSPYSHIVLGGCQGQICICSGAAKSINSYLNTQISSQIFTLGYSCTSLNIKCPFYYYRLTHPMDSDPIYRLSQCTPFSFSPLSFFTNFQPTQYLHILLLLQKHHSWCKKSCTSSNREEMEENSNYLWVASYLISYQISLSRRSDIVSEFIVRRMSHLIIWPWTTPRSKKVLLAAVGRRPVPVGLPRVLNDSFSKRRPSDTGRVPQRHDRPDRKPYATDWEFNDDPSFPKRHILESSREGRKKFGESFESWR